MERDRIEDVVAYLADEFTWSDDVKEACRGSLGQLVMTHRLEFICDSPVTANYRLKWNRETGLRMAWYGNPDSGNGLATAEVQSQELTRLWDA